jgi:cellulose synthase (UDP-forming)
LEKEKRSLTILVPSYKEGLQVVRQTLMSAALQDWPNRRVVLLIDDPQHPSDPEDLASLQAMRALSAELQALFSEQVRVLRALESRALSAVTPAEQCRWLADAHGAAATWFEREISALSGGDHTARWLSQAVLQPLANEHREAMQAFRNGVSSPLKPQATADVFARLIERFELQFTHFERKRYLNLSHEPNKAMNLNAYLALMGGDYHEQESPCGKWVELLPAPPGSVGSVCLPDADFILTLDADSLLLPAYAIRLAEVMLRPGQERLAVIQTPYSAIPAAPGRCERIAGAQTDIQYIMHQGFTAHDATFWVGANALLRKTAIEDIATVHMEEGKWVKKYIHDRTVIEDTESSIDIGSLLIQRRRWADGGLIILPKALRYLLRGEWSRRRLAEGFLRVHYLSSVATVNFAFLLLMFGPFAKNLSVFWIPLAMLAYMVAYARDLRHCGYGWLDFPRVYALNLVLLPVNLGGTLRSLYQACTGRRAPFARTPKVTGRTAAPGAYVALEFLLLGLSLAMAVSDMILGHWISGAMSAVYGAFMAYGITVFIGWRAGLDDLTLWWRPGAGGDAPPPPSRITQEAPASLLGNAAFDMRERAGVSVGRNEDID